MQQATDGWPALTKVTSNLLDPSHSPMKALLVFSERFGNMLSRVFLTLLYFLVLGPFAVVYRLVADPLRIARPNDGNWWIWTSNNETIARARKQD